MVEGVGMIVVYILLLAILGLIMFALYQFNKEFGDD
jgi:uncharacterized membrane protein YsdA (DUF1294 family)